MSLRVADEPEPDVVAWAVRELHAHNAATTGIDDARALFAAVRDDDDALVAAIDGWTWGGTAYVDTLWVRPDARGAGLGTGLLAAAEAEARDRGCAQLVLTTHSFQAPDLHRRCGFEVAGEVDGYPAGHAYYLIRKRLR
jgi:ribosomal protein S18 acetylase RimI-like enzyme